MFVAGLVLMSAVSAAPPVAPLLVTTEWLAGHLKDPGLIVFQIGDDRSKALYDAGHVAGAQFLNPFLDLARKQEEGALYLEVPSAAQLDSVLSAKGVTDQSRIVLYTAGKYFSPLGRAFFTLEYAGLKGRVMVMDGGLETWKAEGRPTSTDVPAPAPGHFTARPDSDMVVDAAWLRPA